MGQTDLKPTAQGQVESSINDTINFIMAKVAAGEIDAATATELIAAARKDYESNVPVTTSAQQAVQLQQTANPYQADPQTAYAVPEMEPEQTPKDDPLVSKMKVKEFLQAIPGIGGAKADKIMHDMDIPGNRRLGGLGIRQAEALLEYLS